MIVTEVSTAPEVGERLVITGKLIVKLVELPKGALAVTTTLPVIEPTGTSATKLVRNSKW